MTYQVPYTFVPGTKAKANEMNSNFSKVTEFFTTINADLNTTQNNLSSTQSNLSDLTKLYQERRSKFCVNSNQGTLLSVAANILHFSPSFVITTIDGTTTTINALDSLTCTSIADGTYNLFVGADKTVEYLKNTIYKQPIEPTTKTVNDIWLNTSQEPLTVGKWDGSNWISYNKVPLGTFTIAQSAVTTATSFPLNQNGYNITTNTTLSSGSNIVKSITSFYLPDFTKGVSKSINTVYQAECDGWAFIAADLSSGAAAVSLDFSLTADFTNVIRGIHLGSSNGGVSSHLVIPVPKGIYYKTSPTLTPTTATTIFYPAKGAN